MGMSVANIHAIEVAEKVSSVCSVLGAIFIITTFVFNTEFRKPINRLVFYAAWGNLFANVATLISRSGISRGESSSLCQFQALLIQWFMPADALWTFSMACNVYLTFFRQFDASDLKGLEWKYLLFCYGLPFPPAFTYLFISAPGKSHVYGSASLWCWVTPRWGVLRIATFYGPVWVIILITMGIYLKVGAVVFKWRRHLLSMDVRSDPATMALPPQPVNMDSLVSPTVSTNKTYEFSIHSQVPHSADRTPYRSFNTRGTFNETPRLSIGPSPSVPDSALRSPLGPNITIHQPSPVKRVDANRAMISYCKTALLFFLALLVTWVPSTINRVYSLVHPEAVSFGLDFASGLVLPLQGFWNTVIYVMSSKQACKSLTKTTKQDFSRVISESSIRHWFDSQRRSLGSTDTRPEILVTVDTTKRVIDTVHESDGDSDTIRHSDMPVRNFSYKNSHSSPTKY